MPDPEYVIVKVSTDETDVDVVRDDILAHIHNVEYAQIAYSDGFGRLIGMMGTKKENEA